MRYSNKGERGVESYEILFSMPIDLNKTNVCDEEFNLRRDGLSPETCKEYSEIRGFAVKVVKKELMDEFKKNGIPVVNIEVNGVYDGSIIIFFTALLGAISVANELHNFISLLSELAQRRMRERLAAEYRNDNRFIVGVQHRTVHTTFIDGSPRRDSFLYYLLISNVVLSVMVISLVLGAVLKVYF